MPSWERAAMLAKYYVTTGGVALNRQTRPGDEAPAPKKGDR